MQLNLCLDLAYCIVKIVFGTILLNTVQLKFCLELAYNTVNVGFGASSLCS